MEGATDVSGGRGSVRGNLIRDGANGRGIIRGWGYVIKRRKRRDYIHQSK